MEILLDLLGYKIGGANTNRGTPSTSLIFVSVCGFYLNSGLVARSGRNNCGFLLEIAK
jgi:hypothetical protein